ncbi:unnamed protein product [Adineta steineri]|uniref:Uncharacterized protein n=1 Tax=Adineta steineri TaxID=433720 RepID=A0A819S187_9BILA|nr:unnamed protein product [Adineta steineri]CAF4054330.1 unnamed protein product [Adineta steineri]
MCIDREEVTSKPIAFVKVESPIEDEEEVILPMGIVFRIVSCEEIDNENSASLVRITMIRSKVEQEVEKKLSEFPVLAPIIATSALAGMTTLLQSLPNSDYGGEFHKFIVDPSKLVDTNLTAPLQNIIDGNLTSIPGMEKLKQVAEKDWTNIQPPQLEPPNLGDPSMTIPNVEVGTIIPPTSRILSSDAEDDRHPCPWLHNLLNRFR